MFLCPTLPDPCLFGDVDAEELKEMWSHVTSAKSCADASRPASKLLGRCISLKRQVRGSSEAFVPVGFRSQQVAISLTYCEALSSKYPIAFCSQSIALFQAHATSLGQYLEACTGSHLLFQIHLSARRANPEHARTDCMSSLSWEEEVW